jgi:hypothetical protein
MVLQVQPKDSRGYFMLAQTPEEAGYYPYGTPGGGAGQFVRLFIFMSGIAVVSFAIASAQKNHWTFVYKPLTGQYVIYGGTLTGS